MAQTAEWRAKGATCHRCGGDLPCAAGDESLFCPHCGAPQLLLPEHLRAAAPQNAGAGTTTGAMPPPRPRLVDWQTALKCGFAVAVTGALLTAAGIASDAADFAAGLWMLGCGVVALTLYGRLRPELRIDARVGARVGLATGALSVAVTMAVLTAGGDVSRYSLHRTGRLNAWVGETMQIPAAMHPAAVASSGDPEADAELAASWKHISGIFASDEGRAGWALVRLGMGWAFLMGFATGGGALAGALGTRRTRVRGVL